MGSVNEIVGREEEDAVAFDVEAAKPYSFLVRVKGESQGNLPKHLQVLHPQPHLFSSQTK